jgi:hypothetical protein
MAGDSELAATPEQAPDVPQGVEKLIAPNVSSFPLPAPPDGAASAYTRAILSPALTMVATVIEIVTVLPEPAVFSVYQQSAT